MSATGAVAHHRGEGSSRRGHRHHHGGRRSRGGPGPRDAGAGARVSVEVQAIEGLPEVRPGDDLAALLAPALRAIGVRDGDVVAVTSKIVSKAEGRLIPGEDRADAVARETVRVVARRGDLVIAETAHGFVCANAGVDASNVEAGTLALLPVDPDGSAARLRDALRAQLHVEVAVVITDTFGRAWREGLVNVAIGCAGMPAAVDLRGSADHFGGSWRRPSWRWPTRWRPPADSSWRRSAHPRGVGAGRRMARRTRPTARPSTSCARVRKTCSASPPCRPCTRAARSARSRRAPCRARPSRRPSTPPAPHRRRTTRAPGGSRSLRRRPRSGGCWPRWRRRGGPTCAPTARPPMSSSGGSRRAMPCWAAPPSSSCPG